MLDQVKGLLTGALCWRFFCLLQELSVCLWSMAKLGYHPGRILADFGRRVEETAAGISPQASCNILWALSVLQARPPSCPLWTITTALNSSLLCTASAVLGGATFQPFDIYSLLTDQCWKMHGVQGTQLPAFTVLLERLGGMAVGEVQVVMLQQLFQALMLARLEAGGGKLLAANGQAPAGAAAGAWGRVPEAIYSLVKECAHHATAPQTLTLCSLLSQGSCCHVIV